MIIWINDKYLIDNLLFQRTIRKLIALGCQTLPKKAMIPNLSGIIEKTAWTGLDNFLQGQILIIGVLDEVVGVVDVSLVMFAVVVVKSLGGHVGSQRVTGVRQLGQHERHEKIFVIIDWVDTREFIRKFGQ
jgi:hypothetical protein